MTAPVRPFQVVYSSTGREVLIQRAEDPVEPRQVRRFGDNVFLGSVSTSAKGFEGLAACGLWRELPTLGQILEWLVVQAEVKA